MKTITQTSGSHRRPRTRLKARAAAPRIEEFERRQLMAADIGFLQGTAFADLNPVPNGTYDPGEALAGATITLFQLGAGGAATQVAQQTTGADGSYRFTGLAAGNYRLTETPPTGYYNSATQTNLSALTPVTASTAGSIDVTVGSPSPAWLVSYPTNNKEEIRFTDYKTAHDSLVGQLNISVTEPEVPYQTPTFPAFCADLDRVINTGNSGLTYSVKPLDQAIPASAYPQNADAIAYLYSKYAFGQTPLTTSQAAGLQLAIWELEYERSSPTPGSDYLETGTFLVAPGTDPAAIAFGNALITEASSLTAGTTFQAAYLDGLAGGPEQPDGGQGLIAPESLNFGNRTSAALGDFVWYDANVNGLQDAGEAGVPRVTATLTDAVGNPVVDAAGHPVAPQQTDANGKYLFTNLVPGTYKVTFSNLPPGYVFTTRDVSANAFDALDSDADRTTGMTGTYTLAPGETNLTVDAGISKLPGTISGTKYRDLTGNGLTPDDTPLGGVTIYLDMNHDGRLDAGDVSTTTASDGTYSFTGLAPGAYTVREVVGSGWIQTGPALTGNYAVTVAPGATSTGNDFANAQVGCGCQISNIVYLINGCRQVSDLRGNVNPGDTVTAKFTVRNASASNPATFSLVSYTAPGSTFVASQAYRQQVFDMATMTYTASGSYSLSVDVPNSYYQVDFVCGKPIDRFGPDGSNIFYSPQGRLFSADNGGCKAYSGAVGADDIGTADFWSGTSGQNLIKGLNGGSTATDLGNWLSANFPHLYGTLAGKSNTAVAAYFKTLKNSSSTALEAQVMSTALSVYVTDYDLAGMAAYPYGFHVSYVGTGAKTFNVGLNGSALGLANGTSDSVWAILTAADGKSSNGTLLGTNGSNRSKATTLFAGLNAAGALGS